MAVRLKTRENVYDHSGGMIERECRDVFRMFTWCQLPKLLQIAPSLFGHYAKPDIHFLATWFHIVLHGNQHLPCSCLKLGSFAQFTQLEVSFFDHSLLVEFDVESGMAGHPLHELCFQRGVRRDHLCCSLYLPISS